MCSSDLALADKNFVQQAFEALAPPQVTGKKTFTLAYGYIDAEGPHYFEKTFNVQFSQNSMFLVLIGIIILVAAIYLYAVKGGKEKEKGKKETEKWEKSK